MKSTLKILFSLLITGLFLQSSAFSQNSGENCRIVVPSYIPSSSEFDISIITSHTFPEADKLELFIIPDEKIYLNKLELRSNYKIGNLNFEKFNLKNFNKLSFKTSIDLSDTTLPADFYFQILANFNSREAQIALVQFYGEFKKGNEIVGYLKNKKNILETNKKKLISKVIRFYNPQRTAGKNIQLGKNSVLDISLKKFNSEKLLADFWLKITNTKADILTIINNQTDNKEYSLSTNQFQMLSATSYTQNKNYDNPLFTGKNSWYHISIFALTNDDIINFYCDGKLFAKCDLPINLEASDLRFDFSRRSSNSVINLDMLRIYDYQNSLDVSFNNSSYLNFIPDSSTIISQINFDDYYELERGNKQLSIQFSGTRLVRSDAPIFAKAPGLNIRLLSNAFELEWKGGDYKQADEYILQKSNGNSDYENIYNASADNSDEKSYSYLDPKDASNEIVYYRIKQINKDGSIVYSSQVKVGQGITEQFVLKQNYPNPFNPKTSIEIELLEDTDVEITVYNLEGREITKLHKGHLSKGIHKFTFDGSELTSGIYLFKVATPQYSQTRKMILAK